MSFRYKQCYEEVKTGIEEAVAKEKSEKTHGALLVLNELLRVSNINWERQNDSLMQRLQWDQNQTSAVRYIYIKYQLIF